MLTAALVLVLLAVTIVGTHLVRSECRRMLARPVAPSPARAAPVARATLRID